jgi:hypothetical protein
VAVPQINKYDPSMISAALHPSHQHHFPVDVGCTQLAAGVGFSHFSK